MQEDRCNPIDNPGPWIMGGFILAGIALLAIMSTKLPLSFAAKPEKIEYYDLGYKTALGIYKEGGDWWISYNRADKGNPSNYKSARIHTKGCEPKVGRDYRVHFVTYHEWRVPFDRAFCD